MLIERALRPAGAVVVPGVGVERLVAEEPKAMPRNAFGALLDRGVDHRARGLAELRRVGARLHLELLQRIDRRLHHLRAAFLQVGRERVVVGAVERVVVPGRVVAVGVEERVFAAARDARRAPHDAWRQERQLRIASAEQRQVVASASRSTTLPMSAVCVCSSSVRPDHHHLLGYRADAQLKIDLRAVCTLRCTSLRTARLKPCSSAATS